MADQVGCYYIQFGWQQEFSWDAIEILSQLICEHRAKYKNLYGSEDLDSDEHLSGAGSHAALSHCATLPLQV